MITEKVHTKQNKAKNKEKDIKKCDPRREG